MKKSGIWAAGAALAILGAGCIQTKSDVEIKPVEIKPIEIKPIQISLDVRVKVDEALEKGVQNAGRGDAAREAIIARLKERKEQLASWKEMGAVGENNRGQVVNRLAADDRSRKVVQILIDAENRDRAELVKLISETQAIPAADVEAGWALRISERAPAGTWLEDAEGTWYQK